MPVSSSTSMLPAVMPSLTIRALSDAKAMVAMADISTSTCESSSRPRYRL